MAWSCSACTYRNKNGGSKKCFACETTRAKASDSMSIDLTSSKDITKKRGAGFQRTLFGGVADVKKEDGIKRAKTAKSEAKTSGVSSQSLLTSNDGLEASYKPLRNESYEVRSTRCHELMKKTFKIDQLRKQQPKAVECALKGQSQVIVMATGGGKSLCYQLPAVVLGGVTVVISPLIALMRDQVSSLTKKGVSAACINSSNKTKENDDILDRVVGRKLKTTKKSGETVLRPISIIYVTPESLQTTSFQNILNELNHKRRLTMFAIDEAHCMSSYVSSSSTESIHPNCHLIANHVASTLVFLLSFSQ